MGAGVGMAAYHDVRLHGVVGGVRRGARHHGCTVQRGCWHKWIVGTVLGICPWLRLRGVYLPSSDDAVGWRCGRQSSSGR